MVMIKVSYVKVVIEVILMACQRSISTKEVKPGQTFEMVLSGA